MASSHKDSKGWRVCYVGVNGDRRSIRPGKVNKATAQQIARQVDVLVASKASGGTIDLSTAKWLGTIGERLYAKFVRAALIEPRAAEPEAEPDLSITLVDFLNEYVNTGVTKKGEVASINTLRNWAATRDLLLGCFAGSRPIKSFTLVDGKAFRQWLECRRIPVSDRSPNGRMKETSIRQRVNNAKSMFAYAVLEELVPQNPFRNQVSSLRGGLEGKQNIPVEVISKVIAAAPTAEWRALIALWRYAGLRKLEPLELTWSDVLWAEGKLMVRSSKTAHHAGKGVRVVPMRDIESFLSDAFAVAQAGQKYVFPHIRGTNTFHRFQAIIEKAGYKPWPNLIKNLRLSCENDWLTANEAPAHVIASWIGHSVAVQNSSYAIVSDGHFDQFNQRALQPEKSGNHSGNQPTRIAANGDENTLPPMLPPEAKRLETSKNTGFQSPLGYFIKKSVDAVKYGTSCTSLKSGNRGGNQAPNSDAYILFTQALKAGGFTPEQLRLISNALQQSRLLVVESVGTES